MKSVFRNRRSIDRAFFVAAVLLVVTGLGLDIKEHAHGILLLTVGALGPVALAFAFNFVHERLDRVDGQ